MHPTGMHSCFETYFVCQESLEPEQGISIANEFNPTGFGGNMLERKQWSLFSIGLYFYPND